LPLKLAWTVTIHKAQGLTLNKVAVDIGKKEFCAGLTFVAISCVKCLSDILFNPPFSFERLRNLAKKLSHARKEDEETRLQRLENATLSNTMYEGMYTPCKPNTGNFTKS